MSKKDEALRLALENICAAKLCEFNSMSSRHEMIRLMDEAIAVIKEALAERFCDNNCTRLDHHPECDKAEQPAQQQEPVAWMWRCKPYCDWPEWSVSLKRPADSGRDGHKRTEGYEDVPLYTSPPASKPWVGLTDEEREQIRQRWAMQNWMLYDIINAVDAKLREKNA